MNQLHLYPGAPISHQRGGAILAGPVVVRHDVTQGDVVAHHQQRRQLGRLVVDDDRVVRGAFTHFNGYGVLVSRSGMVRMVAGFRSGDVLVGSELVHSEVPVQAAGLAAVQVTGVGIGVSFGVGGAVDGDEAGSHGGRALAGIRVFGHVGNFNAYFTAHLAGCAGNYRRLLNFKGDGPAASFYRSENNCRTSGRRIRQKSPSGQIYIPYVCSRNSLEGLQEEFGISSDELIRPCREIAGISGADEADGPRLQKGVRPRGEAVPGTPGTYPVI